MYHHILLFGLVVLGVTVGFLVWICRRQSSERQVLIAKARLVNECLEHITREPDYATVVNAVIRRIGEEALADRCYVYIYQQEKPWVADCCFEWVAPGITPAIASQQNLDMRSFSEVQERLEALEDVIVDRVAVQPEPNKNHLESQAILSLMLTPLRRPDGGLYGYIGIDFVRRLHTFAECDVRTLHDAACLVEVACGRKKQRDELLQSTAMQKQIFDHVNIPMLLFSPEGRIINLNPAADAVLQTPREELIGSFCHTYVCGQPERPSWCPLNETCRTGKCSKIHFTGHGDRKFQVTTQPIFMPDGELRYVLETAVDVSELQELIANEQMMNYCLETFFAADDIMTAVRHVLKAIASHTKAEHCCIYRCENRDGQGVATLFDAYTVVDREPLFTSDREVHFDLQETWYQRLLTKEFIVLDDLEQTEQRAVIASWGELCVRRHLHSAYLCGIWVDGQLWGDFGIIYEEDEHGRSEARMKLLYFATHLLETLLSREQTARRLQLAMEKAQAAEKAKSAFLATMSHELRTPLNTVIGFSELLGENDIPPSDAAEYVRSINVAGKALLSLINDVLDLSKIEADQITLVPVATRLTGVFEELELIFRQSARNKHLNLNFEGASSVPPQLMLDDLRLRQILLNLIGNAIKFTNEGGITVSASWQQGELTLVVRDTGVGIAEELKESIFAPFVQQNPGRDTRLDHGTGLGLAICRKLAEKMGGSIALESRPGEGSTFVLRLPGIPIAEPSERLESGAGAALPLPSRVVLVVDDIPMNLKLVRSMLTRLEVVNFGAVSGDEALAELRRHPEIDTVLTDLWMPGVNGFELARTIHGNPDWARVKVVILTADSECRPQDAGDCEAVLLKPITRDKLQDCLLKLDTV